MQTAYLRSALLGAHGALARAALDICVYKRSTVWGIRLELSELHTDSRSGWRSSICIGRAVKAALKRPCVALQVEDRCVKGVENVPSP
jgi:hypothetical protein